MPRAKDIPEGGHPNRVREIRNLRGLTLKQLSEITGLFFTQIAKLETGERPGKDFEFRAIADALGVTPADLLRFDEGALSDEERLMVDTYRDLPPAMKRAIDAMITSQQDQREGAGVEPLPEAAPAKPKRSSG